MYYSTEIFSPLGRLTLASDGIGLVGLWIEGQKYFLDSLQHKPQRNDDIDVFRRTKIWLDSYFDGKKPHPDELPLAPIGSDFRRYVWEELCKIPYGSVTTYGEIAKKIVHDKGLSSMSAQAVGGAISHNPIAIIIPCHRVIGINGSLTGYAAGINKKIKLLEIEGIDTKLMR